MIRRTSTLEGGQTTTSSTHHSTNKHLRNNQVIEQKKQPRAPPPSMKPSPSTLPSKNGNKSSMVTIISKSLRLQQKEKPSIRKTGCLAVAAIALCVWCLSTMTSIDSSISSSSRHRQEHLVDKDGDTSAARQRRRARSEPRVYMRSVVASGDDHQKNDRPHHDDDGAGVKKKKKKKKKKARSTWQQPRIYSRDEIMPQQSDSTTTTALAAKADNSRVSEHQDDVIEEDAPKEESAPEQSIATNNEKSKQKDELVLENNDNQTQQQQQQWRVNEDPPPETKLGSLHCKKYGGPSAKDAQEEMVYWKDIPHDREWKSPFLTTPINKKRKYLSVEVDEGGWNNIRMTVEIAMAMAHATGRTFVIPPRQGMLLLEVSRCVIRC